MQPKKLQFKKKYGLEVVFILSQSSARLWKFRFIKLIGIGRITNVKD